MYIAVGKALLNYLSSKMNDFGLVLYPLDVSYSIVAVVAKYIQYVMYCT